MKCIIISMAVALVAGVAVAIPLEDRDELPKFLDEGCPDQYGAYDLCLKVEYVDGFSEYLLLIAKPGMSTILRGHPESNPNTKAVLILGDEDEPNDTIVFKSPHAPNCKQYSTQIKPYEGEEQTTICLKTPPHMAGQNADSVGGLEPQPTDRSLYEQKIAPRALDSRGYKIDVMIYYDDLFNNQFSNPKTRISAVMAIVDEMYSESDTLKTTIDVNTVAAEHMPGKDWGHTSWNSLLNTVGKYARSSRYEADLYVFMTGSKSEEGLGLAWVGTVCNRDRVQRVSLNKYATGHGGADAYTAETVAHEMGHNLGMEHDCLNGNCAHWDSSYKGPRTLNGVDCYGYMDYKDGTDGWSACSVADFTKYINRQRSFCLPTLNGASGGGNGGGSNVCIQIGTTTKQYANEISWTICSNGVCGCSNEKTYWDNETYFQDCCLPSGSYTLTCNDAHGDGFNGGYLFINGLQYCKDFNGKETTDTVTFA